ncbi:MAG: hypothetical protein DMD60_14225 [Gemmatimonadetes bacterium]|nr:MAG: hypothetical protein DMD60_14225 [Gemmatimonadota bacterium]
MNPKQPNPALLDAIVEAALLGTTTEAEFQAEWTAAGGTITDGGPLAQAPDAALAELYHAAPKGKGMRLYLAALLVARGLTACGCETCQMVETDARAWAAVLARKEGKVCEP